MGGAHADIKCPNAADPGLRHSTRKIKFIHSFMMGGLNSRRRTASKQYKKIVASKQSVTERPFRRRPSKNRYRFIVIGNENVGKSCLLSRFASDNYKDDHYIATIGIDFVTRTVDLDGEEYKLQMFDTAGAYRFRTLTTAYYRGADGIVIVYSATDEDSFNSVECYWLKHVQQYCSVGTKLLLLGNKCDAERGKKVDYSTVKDFAEEKGIPFFEVSAKDGTNVELAFLTLLSELAEADRLLPDIESYTVV